MLHILAASLHAGPLPLLLPCSAGRFPGERRAGPQGLARIQHCRRRCGGVALAVWCTPGLLAVLLASGGPNVISIPPVQRDFVRKRGAAAASAPPRLPPAGGSSAPSDGSPSSSATGSGSNASAPDAAGGAAVEMVPAVPGGAAVGAGGEDERRLLEGMELVMRTVSLSILW